ncbi:protein LNK2-like isoform X4 [Tasmannia lanceolata]|uniref:protein LNK2-like isoform X4 n=1 Tax=Tasmannia lanceolata TaxID=3420 RepID=UPI0040632800
MDPWPNLLVSTTSSKGYADRNGWDLMGSEVSNDFAKATNLDSVKDDILTEFCDYNGIIDNKSPTSVIMSCHFSTADTALPHSDRELFGNGHGDKGSGSFLDYNWDSVENFDDFDRIFRNDDSILGHEMIGNADELWPFPMAPNSPTSQFRLLGTAPEKDQVKMEFPPYQDQPLTSDCKKINDMDSCSTQNVPPSGDGGSEKGYYSFANQVDESFGRKIKFELEEKFSNEKILSRKHFKDKPHIHSDHGQCQLVLDSYKFSPDMLKYGTPLQKLPDVHSSPLTMTPQEKIEKLRQHQQMQAMIAIQHQQQQFDHQVNGSETEVEENSVKVLILGLNLPIEPYDSNKTSMLVGEHSLDETTFDDLQSAIGKLDSRIRLCIRGSLFRLAKSATQRHSISDTSSTNESIRDENEETNVHCRSSRLANVETDTNPIDRIMAHLLFHRPSESCGRPVKDEIPDSPGSGNPKKLSVQPETEGHIDLDVGCFSHNLTDKQSISRYECQSPQSNMSVDPQQDQFQSSPFNA